VGPDRERAGAGTRVEFSIPETPVPVDEDARTDEAAA
jgi:hypothetical protein